MSGLLEVVRLRRAFGGVVAVDDVSFEVAPGSIHAVIGPNGAGKTTVLDLITGFTRAQRGTVRFDGVDISGVQPRRLPNLGLMRTFQAARLVPGLSVRENVMLGGYRFTRARMLSDGLGLPRGRRETRALGRRADELLAFLELGAFADTLGGELPAGAQRLVEVARGLAGGPKLLMLDEPAAGLDDSETRELADVLVATRAGGVALLLIEHNIELVMSTSDAVTVLDAGRVIADGPPADVRADERVVQAYLGAEV